MATETKTRPRKPRTSPEHDKLVMYCQMSVRVLTEVDAQQPSDNIKGQVAALRAVLRQLGAPEAEI